MNGVWLEVEGRRDESGDESLGELRRRNEVGVGAARRGETDETCVRDALERKREPNGKGAPSGGVCLLYRGTRAEQGDKELGAE